MELEYKIKQLVPPDIFNMARSSRNIIITSKNIKSHKGWYSPPNSICFYNINNPEHFYFRTGEFLIALRKTDFFLLESCIFKSTKYSAIEQHFYDVNRKSNMLDKNGASPIFYVFPWEL